MKKILSLLVASVLGMSLLSCSSSVVLEENTKIIENIKKYEVVETPIQGFENKMLMPYKYEDNIIYGVSNGWGESETGGDNYIEGFMVDKNGGYQKYENSMYFETKIEDSYMWSYVGLTKEFDEDEQLEYKKEYYYRDNHKNLTVRVDGLNEVVNSFAKKEYQYITWNMFTFNEDEFLYIELNLNNTEGIGEQYIFIKEIDSDVICTFYQTSKKDIVYGTFYDSEVNGIIGFTEEGKIKKIICENGSVKYEDYGELNLQGYDVNYKMFIINEITEGKYSIPILNSESYIGEDDLQGLTTGLYDSKTGDFTILDEGIIIQCAFGDSLVTLYNNNETYLGQVMADNTIEHIYKFDKEEHDLVSVNGIMNEEGNRIFISKKYWEEMNTELNVEYSFIDLK